MYTYSGIQIDDQAGAPNMQDVAVALGRTPRLCGASRVWWTYLHYSFALVEFALIENEHYEYAADDVVAQALIREAHASVTVLWEPGREFKDLLQARIHTEWEVPYAHVDSRMKELIDRASTRAFLAEVDTFGPEEMKELPIFGTAPPDDCAIIEGIWGILSNADDTCDPRSEAQLAYYRYFKERDIPLLRHRVGYEKKQWFRNLCVSLNPTS